MKNKVSLLLIFSAMLLLIISSCDYVDPPYKQNTTGGGVDTTTYVKKILIEDYTGHQCVYCPLAASMLTYLADTLYKGQVIPLAVHTGQLAEPIIPPPTNPFEYDFTTSEGDALGAFFGIGAVLPLGMLNRTGYKQGNYTFGYTEWPTIADTLLYDANSHEIRLPDADIKITNTYDAGNKTINTIVVSKFLNQLSGIYKLCVVYNEDSIHQPQLSPTGVINNYYHMHVLRGAFNTEWGETIATDPTENLSVTKQYSKQIVADAVPEHCKVVAFIYNDDTKEIIQAEEKEFK